MLVVGLPGFKWPSRSAIEPGLTFSIIAPIFPFGNKCPPVTFKPNILLSSSGQRRNTTCPIICLPSDDTCQLVGSCFVFIELFWFLVVLGFFVLIFDFADYPICK